MIRPLILALALATPATPAAAADVPGLAGAALLPGWTTAEGTRMAAVELRLEPGWKTYWRAPGDAGIPPSFDWTGSANLGTVAFHWPAPEVIDSGGTHTLGFHDRLLLPVEITPRQPGQPVDLAVAIDFGLCREVCVPAHVALTAPAAGTAPDPRIEAALATVPQPAEAAVACRISPIADGTRLSATIPAAALPDAPRVAMELDDSSIWVSEPEVARDADGLTATADFVAPSGKPFALDPAGLRLTLIGKGRAVEIEGCTPTG